MHVNKRMRTDSTGNTYQPTSHNQSKYDTIRNIRRLQRQQTDEILIKAAEIDHNVANLINEAAKQQYPRSNPKGKEKQKEEKPKITRVINFDHYSKEVWKSLNAANKRAETATAVGDGSTLNPRLFEIAFNVVEKIIGSINEIVQRCRLFASPHTRLKGLTVLRKIGKSICLAPMDALGYEVKRQIADEHSTCLADGMVDILKGMPFHERKVLAKDRLNSSAFWNMLVELDGYGLFGNLKGVMNMLLCEGEVEGTKIGGS